MSKEEKEIISQVEELSFDQAGCRLIQRLLEANCSSNFVAALVRRMLGILPDVMVNQFGNYLVQKIIEVSCASEIALVIEAVSA